MWTPPLRERKTWRENGRKGMSKEKETTEQRLKRFEKAYNILMDYFNDLPEETRIEVDERLNKENL